MKKFTVLLLVCSLFCVCDAMFAPGFSSVDYVMQRVKAQEIVKLQEAQAAVENVSKMMSCENPRSELADKFVNAVNTVYATKEALVSGGVSDEGIRCEIGGQVLLFVYKLAEIYSWMLCDEAYESQLKMQMSGDLRKKLSDLQIIK